MKKSEKSLPDANAVIRYLTRDDNALYVKTKAFFDKVRDGSIKAVIIESVIVECIYVLTKIYKVPKNEAAASLIDVLHYKGVANEDQKELIRALTLFQESNIDIVDCILCSKSLNPDMSLFSFDDALNKVTASLSESRREN